MNNYKHPGDVVTLISPSGGVASGGGYIVGDLFVVATNTVPEGEEFEGLRRGVVGLAKTSGLAWTAGQLIYWDEGAGTATPTEAGNRLIGVANFAELDTATSGVVVLDGAARKASAATPSMFVSTVQTGTGAPQNIPHGMGVTPSSVVVVPYDLAPATTGDYTATEGAHDATNVVVTVTTAKTYKVMAYA